MAGEERGSGMKDCRDCAKAELCTGAADVYPCRRWKPIECPNCGGRLSEIRFNGRTPVRHCFSCHMEIDIILKRPETPAGCFEGMA